MIVIFPPVILVVEGKKAQVSCLAARPPELGFSPSSFLASTAASLEHSPFQESPGEKPNVDSPARHGDAAAKMPQGPCRGFGRAGLLWGPGRGVGGNGSVGQPPRAKPSFLNASGSRG